jgi:hypothetical protein
MNASPAPARSAGNKIATFLILALGGAFAGFGMVYLNRNIGDGWEDTLALGAGTIPLAMAAMIALTLLTRRGVDVMKGCGGLQIVVMVLAGLMMLLPMIGPRFASPGLIMVVLFAMLIVQGAANLLLWRRADEMLRRIMTETATLAFWALQTALFLYAAGERLGLVQGVTAWGMMGILMGVYFFASAIAAARRGIH